MKAIILAAGYGKRMRPLTDKRHKTLLKVGGKTILGRIIDGLHENNITDIAIVTGFRAEDIKKYLETSYATLSFSFIHNERYHETNNIFSLALAFDAIKITSDIIIIESDLIFNPSIIKTLISSVYENVALVDKFRSGMDGTVVTVEKNVITSVIPPHLQDENFNFSDKYKTLNIYKFSQDFCQTTFKKLLSYYANVIDDNCYYELILGILIYMQHDIINAEIIESDSWAEVDDPNDLAIAEFIFNRDRQQILEQGFGGFWNYDTLDFCFIRNMYFPDSSIISEMKNNLANLIYNYGSKQSILNQKMAWFLLCKSERVIALNGASQIYPIIKNRLGHERALLPCPTFGEYPRIFNNAIYYNDEVGIDITEIEEKIGGCSVVVFVNPNNPTGSEIPPDWIFRTAKYYPDKFFIIDESFIEFSSNASCISLLEEYLLQNILIIKSLSKSLGIPGIRLGYTYCGNQDFNTYIHECIPIWNMNSLAEFTLEIMLKHRNTLRQSIYSTIKDRDDFCQRLNELECINRVYPSAGNFLLVQLKNGIHAQDLVKEMLINHSIYIKDVSNKFVSGEQYLRFAVRFPQENNLLVEKLDSLG